MYKKYVLIFSILILLPLLSFSANAGCCFDISNPSLFCTATATNCNVYDSAAQCSANCYAVTDSCCIDTCKSAKVGTYSSPKLCSAPSKFVTGSCSLYSDCRTGCVFCHGDVYSIGFYYMREGQAQCQALKTTYMSWFRATTNQDICTGLTQPREATITISGTVKDTSNRVLENVTVTAAGKTTTTISDGTYALTNMPQGTYTLSASKPGYESKTITLTDVATSLSGKDFSLLQINPPAAVVGKLSGIVYNSASVPVANAIVSIAGFSNITGANGRYEISNIPIGTYTASATPPSTSTDLTQTSDVVNIIQATITKNFILPSKAAEMTALTVIVKDTAAPPANIGGATIVIKKIDAVAESARGTTDSSGQFIANLMRANYTIVIFKETYETQTIAATLDAPTKTVPIALKQISAADKSISGRVTDSMTGDGIADASVFIPAPLAELVKSALTDSSGNYKIEGVMAANYTLITQKAGYVEGSRTSGVATTTGENIPLLPARCLTGVASPNITSIELLKDLTNKRTNVRISFNTECSPGLVYVYRCKGAGCTLQPIADGISILNNAGSYTDLTVEAGETYNYQIMAYYDNFLLDKVFSEPKTISLGEAECFAKVPGSDEVCVNNTRSKCGANNTVKEISDTTKNKNSICMYKTQITTVYVNDVDCSQCNPPLGMFSYAGFLNVPREGVNELVSCSADMSLFPEARACYVDYTKSAVNKYFSCKNVKSCYDYQSESACVQNKCAKDMPCHWVAHTTFSDLGMGVCVPDDEKNRDCSRCEKSGKFNDLFLNCSQNLCTAYGSNSAGTSSSCYYTTGKHCVNKKDSSCEVYYKDSSNNGCGTTNTNKVDMGANKYVTNSINPANKSTDYFGFGLCKFNLTSYPVKCVKDANDDNLRDPNPTDMQPPYTVVLHPKTANEINFDYVVYDPLNSTPVSDAKTFLCAGTPSESCFTEASEGKIKYLDIPPNTQQDYTVNYYSQDTADNLEIIRPFTVTIDKIPPTVAFNWLYGIGTDIIVTLSSDDILSCDAAMKSQDGEALQTENNLLLYEPARSFSRTYQLTDGIYYYNYTCYDLVGNPTSAQKVILVDKDNLVFNGKPSGTINYNSVTLSVETMIDADCRYDSAPIISESQFSSAKSFSTTSTDKRHHTAQENLGGYDNNAFNYYVRCKSLDTQQLTKSSMTPKIAFSIDRTAPVTGLVPAEATTNWSKSWDVAFNCYDAPIFGIYPEFGCNSTRYCISNTDCTPSTSAGKGVTVSEYKKLCYFSVDSGGNMEAVKVPCDQIKVDKDAPRVEITSGDLITKENKVDVTIKMNNSAATKLPQSKIKEIEFMIDGVEVDNRTAQSITELTQTYPVALPPSLTETFNPDGNEGAITVAVIDEAGNRGVSAPIKVTVDRWGSDVTPVLDPELNTYLTMENIDKSYPHIFFETPFTYYTNSKQIYISGTTAETRETLKFWINNAPVTAATYKQPLANATTDERFVAAFTINKGSNELIVSGILLADMQAYKGKYVKFESHSRQSYSNYGKFYKIIAVTLPCPAGSEYSLVSGLCEANSCPSSTAYNVADMSCRYSPVQDDCPAGTIINASSGLCEVNPCPSGTVYDTTNKLCEYSPVQDDCPAETTLNATSGLCDVTDWPGRSVIPTCPSGTRYSIPAKLCRYSPVQDDCPAETTLNATSGLCEANPNCPSGTTYNTIAKLCKYSPVQNDCPRSTTLDSASGMCRATPAGSGAMLTLNAGVEKTVAKGEAFTIYDTQLPSNNFIAQVELNDILADETFSNNTLYVSQQDKAENEGAPTDKYNIIYETTPPDITSETALVDAGTIALTSGSSFHSLEGINFTIYEQFDLLNWSVELNGATIASAKSGSAPAYTVNVPKKFENGHYNLTLNVTDLAGNSAGKTFDFNVDNLAPRRPNVTVIGRYGVAPDSYIMTPLPRPDFNVKFPDAVPVTISEMRLRNLPHNMSCIANGNNNFTCSLPSEVTNLPEGDYEIIITAFKQLAERKSDYAKYSILFAVDHTPPAIIDFELANKFISNSSPVQFSAIIKRSSEKHPLKANVRLNRTQQAYVTDIVSKTAMDLFFGSITQENLSAEGIYLSHDETWTLLANISDYAGNYNDSNTATLIIDTIPPSLDDSVKINAKPIYWASETLTRGLEMAPGEQPVFQYEKYTVKEDLISVTGIVTDVGQSKVNSIMFERSGVQIGEILKPCTSIKKTNCFNSTTGAFYFKANSTVIGEVGAVTPNVLSITAIDNASNKFRESYYIERDIERPRVTICIEGECAGEGAQEEAEVITDSGNMESRCSSSQNPKDCYKVLITRACKAQTKVSAAECFEDYIVEIGRYELYPLCDYTELLRDDCIYSLAKKTNKAVLCEYIHFATLATKCVAATTSTTSS